MKKILLLSTLVIILLGSIIYINYSTQLNVDYKNEGIIIQYPFNQLHINKDALSASSDTHLISAYYYMNNKNMDDYHFFTLNTFDLTYYLFTEKGVKDEVYYDSFLNSSFKNLPKEYSPYKRLINGAPAVLYHYQKDMGDNILIPTKVAIICCNRKAYYLEVSAVGNVNKWFDRIEQSISFSDFAKGKRYGIAFIILLSIGVAIALSFIIREIITLIKNCVKQKSKVIWINKRAHNLYKYIKATIILGIIVGLIVGCSSSDYGGDLGMLIIIETLVKNGLILVYLKKIAMQEYSEDYLVPKWFKDKFYKYLNNKSELRAILLFLFMPLFYIIPLPCGTYAIVFYILPVCLLIGAYYGFKWIKAGKNESL